MKLLAVLLLAVLVGCSAPPASAAAPPAGVTGPVITSRGVGTVTGTPDTVTIVLGVATRGANATAALDDNSARATAVIDALTAAGVAEADLRTSQLSIYPTYDQAGARITGYEVTNQVTATVRDVGAAGGIVDAAAAAAGDAVRVQQLGFSLADDAEPRARARADAVAQAQTEARQLADAAGVRLGPIRSITELVADAPIPYALDGAAARSEAATPVLPGTQDVEVTVEIVHDLVG